MSFTVEYIERIWNDKTGEAYEVGDDRDGLGITEIRFRCDDGKIEGSFTLPDEVLNFALEALASRVEGPFEGFAPLPFGDEIIEFGEDRDGLDMTELRYRSNGKVENAFTISNEVLPFVVAALKRRIERKRGK